MADGSKATQTPQMTLAMTLVQPPQTVLPVPWRADLSNQDMAILVWGRLPDPATVDDVMLCFVEYHPVKNDEWVQFTVEINKWFGLHVYWYTIKFYYERNTQKITSIDVRYGSDL